MNTPNPNSTPEKTPDSGIAEGAKASGETKDAIELLKADHREVEQLFKQIESAKGPQRKKLVEKIGAALTAHTIIEEEIFYPACREKGVDHDDLDEAQVEHDTVKLLVADLLKSSHKDEYFDAKVTVLSEYVKHHVGEEEHPSDGIFARAKSAGLDMDGLGKKLQARKDELMSDEKRLIGRPQKIRSLDLSHLSQEYGDMSRYPTDRNRDDENRYDGYRSSGEHRGREFRGGDHDGENRGSSLSHASRGDLYRDNYDEDFGPNRGAYGESDYDRSARGYPDDNRAGYRAGPGPGQRRIEQSGSGGRYRLESERDDRYPRPDSDHEYYQRTRYGSGHQGHDDHRQEHDDRYYSGQGRGTTRGGDFGGRGAYGPSNDWERDQGRHDLGGRDDGNRDTGRRDLGSRDDNRRGPGGFRGIR
jgi:hemerythrin superfamily protein